jgi:hypothetical protein
MATSSGFTVQRFSYMQWSLPKKKKSCIFVCLPFYFEGGVKTPELAAHNENLGY